MKNARLLALAAATILSGCAQGGIDPFAGGAAPPPAEEPQYFVRYPDGTIAPVQPSVVAGFGTPPGAPMGAGVVYAPPLQVQAPPGGGAQALYHATPPAQPAPGLVAAPAPIQAPAQPALAGPPRVAYVGPAAVGAPAPAAFEFPSASPTPATAPVASPVPSPVASVGAAPAVRAGGSARIDPALAEALRRQGIDPSEVVGLEYEGGQAAVPPGAAANSAPAPGPMAALTPPPAAAPAVRSMAPVASPRDAVAPGLRAPQAAAPAPAARSAGGSARMDPALAEALRRQGIDPSEVVGLEYEGGLAAVSPGAMGAPAPAPARGPVSREGATGAPDASPAPRMSPVRRAAPAVAAPEPVRRAAAAAPAPRPQAAPTASSAGSATGVAGGSWRLTMLRGQPVSPGVELHFDGTENFAGGSGPCSPYRFEFTERAGGALSVDGVGADPRACGRSEEEERYFTMLNLVSGYRMTQQGNLELLGAGGALLASFQPF